MFGYRVFDRGGNYLERVEHERELVRNQCVMEDGTVYAGIPPSSSATFFRDNRPPLWSISTDTRVCI
jgi:hypothetical protein